VVDEVDKIKMNVELLIKLLDNENIWLNIKGGMTLFNFKEIYLISNKKMEDVFSNEEFSEIFRRASIMYTEVKGKKIKLK
jgi:hypothetical protein